MIDKIIEKAYNFTLFSFERFRYEMTIRINLARVLLRKNWNKRYKEKIKKIQYRELISKVNYRYLNVYVERLKMYNALIIQLKINKIKFNKFLHERRVFDVLIAYCQYNKKHMIIKYVLLFCSKWKKKLL